MHIEKLNIIQHNHSLVAIKDTFSVESKRYLTYYDEKWECKLFLNLLIYNRVVDKMKVVYPFYESVIIKKPKKVNV